MKIKINYIIIAIIQFLYFFGFGQKNLITQYENENYPKLNLRLYGNVEYLRKVTENIINENNEELEYFFDKNNQPIKIVEASLGLDILARKLRNENTIYSFDKGYLITELNQIDNGLDGYVYKRDDDGNITHKKFYVKNILVSENISEYNQQNKLIKSTDYSYGYFGNFNSVTPKNKDDSISMIETFKYDKLGNLIEDTMNNIKGNVFKKHLYKYDPNGNRIEEGWCKSYNGLSDKNKCNYNPSIGWIYNEKNQMIKKYAIGNWSPHNTDTYYKYDNTGRKIEAKGFYITKKDTVLGFLLKYGYDDYGNKVKDANVDGRYIRLGIKKPQIELIEYDEFQNITLKEIITENNQRIKVIKFKYIYDDKNNWIERRKMEGKTSNSLELTEITTQTINYYNK